LGRCGGRLLPPCGGEWNFSILAARLSARNSKRGARRWDELAPLLRNLALSLAAKMLISFPLPQGERKTSRKIICIPSPPSEPVPTITSFRFGYTGPHNRRGGAGDPGCRPYASDRTGAAQKMVCLSLNKGACVCRTHTGPGHVRKDKQRAAADGPELRGKTHRTGHVACHL
jgi:hypothetical protein